MSEDRNKSFFFRARAARNKKKIPGFSSWEPFAMDDGAIFPSNIIFQPWPPNSRTLFRCSVSWARASVRPFPLSPHPSQRTFSQRLKLFSGGARLEISDLICFTCCPCLTFCVNLAPEVRPARARVVQPNPLYVLLSVVSFFPRYGAYQREFGWEKVRVFRPAGVTQAGSE